MSRPLDADERASMIAILKMGWFLVVTAGNVIAGRDPDIALTAKQADQLSKNLDNFLKDVE